MGDVQYVQAGAPLITRADVAQREIDVRLLEWDVPADIGLGDLELFEAGTRIHTEGGDVDAVARLDHLDPPFGRVVRTWSQKDGPYATLKASRTPIGDQALELASDGTYKGPSVGFVPAEPREWRTAEDGRRIAVRNEMDLREVSLTWRPAHKSATIVAVRSEGPNVTQTTETPAAGAAPGAAAAAMPEGDVRQLLAAFEGRIAEKFAQLEERARKDVDIPGVPRAVGDPAKVSADLVGRWVRAWAMAESGDRVPDLELRALADVTTADNLGVVPKNVRSEVLGIIDPARPFLESTRKVDAGDSGVTQTFPRITQRPLVGVQAAEKDELASRKTIIGTVDFGMTTIGGAGDLSLQLIKRSSPAFLQLWLDLLAEAYAIEADDKAVDALLASGVLAGTGTFDPETFKFGEAFTNGAAASPGMQLGPDRMWLSTAAFVAMIDARTPAGGGGTPMYPGLVTLEGIQNAGNGGPRPLRIRPIWVPALDDEAVDVVIGPSRGFAWAEDGTYRLEADVPSKAGKDVGLAGMIWFMPVYPAAFTTYALAA